MWKIVRINCSVFYIILFYVNFSFCFGTSRDINLTNIQYMKLRVVYSTNISFLKSIDQMIKMKIHWSKNLSVVNIICISSFHYTHVITYRKHQLKWTWRLTKAKQPKWNVTLNKWWNWSSCTKLAVSASWTHGLIAQWVYRNELIHMVCATEPNSVVMGSNPTQVNFL